MNDDDITKCEFFLDNYFTSCKLMEESPDNKILTIGTVKENKISVR